MSPADLSARTAELAAALEEYGLAAGQRVGILAAPGPDATVALLAAVRAGAVPLVLDPAFSGEELAAVLRGRAVVQAVAGDDRDLRELREVRADLPDLELVLVALPDRSDRPIPALCLDAACRAGAAALDRDGDAAIPRTPRDPAVEVARLGGGGRAWSEAELLAAGERLANAMGLVPGDAVLSRLPAAHEDQIPLTVACLLRGVPLVFHARPSFSFAALAEFDATIAVIGSPDLDSLSREIVAAGAARSWVGRRAHRWALERGRDRERHTFAHRIAEALVLRELRQAAGPGLRQIRVLGTVPEPESVALLGAVGFTVAGPPDGGV